MNGGVAAILLAAGQSTRMGSCKQLLPLIGGTVVVRCVRALVSGGVGELVVVVAEEGNGVADAVRDYPVRIVANSEGEGDMASSVRAGRDFMVSEASGVIIALCDYPLVTAATITRLQAAHGDFPDGIIIPCCREQRGHPLLFPRQTLNELAGNMILRDLVRRDPGRVICLDVNDPGVLLDMDTPEDYRRIYNMMTL